jgi:hypothetical protein
MIPFCILNPDLHSDLHSVLHSDLHSDLYSSDLPRPAWAGLPMNDPTRSSQKFLGFQNPRPDHLGGLAMNTGPAQRLLRSQTGPSGPDRRSAQVDRDQSEHCLQTNRCFIINLLACDQLPLGSGTSVLAFHPMGHTIRLVIRSNFASSL